MPNSLRALLERGESLLEIRDLGGELAVTLLERAVRFALGDDRGLEAPQLAHAVGGYPEPMLQQHEHCEERNREPLHGARL